MRLRCSSRRPGRAPRLTIPLFARSVIYEAKVIRGFWPYRWFTTTPHEQIVAALAKVLQRVGSGALRIPEGQPLRLEDFAEAVRLAEAPAHGGKPLFTLAG